jgi:hypothetical protein
LPDLNSKSEIVKNEVKPKTVSDEQENSGAPDVPQAEKINDCSWKVTNTRRVFI